MIREMHFEAPPVKGNQMNVQTALETLAADAQQGHMLFPTHADVAMRVWRSLDDPACSGQLLSTLIGAEPLLAARIVAVANSAAYNASGRVSGDLPSAVARLGFNMVRSLAAAFIIRQMQEMPSRVELRVLAARLWEHTAHVAVLARVIARRVTHLDPEAAFFAGIVHAMGGFYLLSRAPDFPGLLEQHETFWYGNGEAKLGRAVLLALGVPEQTQEACAAMWRGYLSLPPESMGDTLLLARELAPLPSPLGGEGVRGDIDLQLGDETLNGILADSAEETAALFDALHL